MHKAAPRWSRRKLARPAELTAAALALFVEHGYAATRLEDVAAAAGVSKGTLYLYFESKDALFKAVVREGLVSVLERGERMLAEHRGSSLALLTDLIWAWWELIGSQPISGLAKLMFSECRNFPELAQFYHDEVISRGHRIIEAALTRGMLSGEFRRADAALTARLVCAPQMMFSIWRHSFQACEAQPVDAQVYIRRHLELMSRALLVQAEDQLDGAGAQKDYAVGHKGNGSTAHARKH